jgi:hypothetical protein
MPAKILVTVASLVTMGFGIWHFFIPKVWNWYSYIDAAAPELIIAVRAINVFFSLSLVLFGLMNIFLAFGNRSGKYPTVVVLSATCVLWLVRVLFQIIHPQGSASPTLQYGMLSVFIVVFLCYFVSLGLVVLDKSFG